MSNSLFDSMCLHVRAMLARRAPALWPEGLSALVAKTLLEMWTIVITIVITKALGSSWCFDSFLKGNASFHVIGQPCGTLLDPRRREGGLFKA